MKKDLRFSSRKIQREIDLAQHAVKKFRKVTNTKELDYNWSAFIDHNYKAQDALIRAAKDIPGLRPWGHQTENFRRDDSILNYLFFSRNSDVHRDWEPANIEAKQHIIGGVFQVGGDAINSGFKDCTIVYGDGRRDDKVTYLVDQNDDGTERVTCETEAHVAIVEPIFELKNAFTLQGKEIPVPQNTDLGSEGAISIAEYALEWLETKWSEHLLSI